MTPSSEDRRWLEGGSALAEESVAQGGGPFGAVIVRDGELLVNGQNRVTRDNDPTAHAEVVALRAAGRALASSDLTGTALYSSCEPCPMCMASSLWARVDRVVYAADRHDAAAGGFDDLEFYELFARDRSSWATAVDEIALPSKAEPFDAWRANEERVAY